MKIEQLLFENFNELRNAYDRTIQMNGYVSAARIMMQEEIEKMMNDRYALKFFGRIGSHPVDIYQFLMRRNFKFDPPYNDASRVLGQWNRAMAGGSSYSLFNLVDDFVNEIMTAIEEIIEKTIEKEEKDDYKVIHKASNFVVFQVFSKGASCRLGSDTKWCISARGDRNYYSMYAPNHHIYIVHTRRDKYAFIVHKNTGQLVEYQRGDNDFREFDNNTKDTLVQSLNSDGVRMSEIEQAIGIKLTDTKYVEYLSHEVEWDEYLPVVELHLTTVGQTGERQNAIRMNVDLERSGVDAYKTSFSRSLEDDIKRAFSFLGIQDVEVTDRFEYILSNALAKDNIRLIG